MRTLVCETYLNLSHGDSWEIFTTLPLWVYVTQVRLNSAVSYFIIMYLFSFICF